MGQLAKRAADDASVLEALQTLSTVELRVLEAYSSLQNATIDEVLTVLPDDEQQVRTAVSRLYDMALLWGGPQLQPVRCARQAFGAHPCGLAGVGHVSVDEQQILAAAAQLDPQLRERLVWDNPVDGQPNPLMVSRGDSYVLPREWSLVLRQGRFLRPASPPRLPQVADPAGGALLWAPVAGVRFALGELRREPLAWHPVRGVARRALSDRAARMRVPVDDLVVWLELANMAGLVGGEESHAGPTEQAARWLAAEPEQMWLDLIEGWLSSNRPLLACRPESLGCLSTADTPRFASHRRHVLRVWPSGVHADREAVAAALVWELPRMHEAQAQLDDIHGELLHLGLIEADVATAALDLLPDDPTAAAQFLPGVHGEASLVVQPDATIMAPATVDSDTWGLLEGISVVDSWGPMSIHRIDPARMRATVAVEDPDVVLARLARASRTPIPQPVEYLIRDASRTSSARVYSASVVEVPEADHPAALQAGLQQVGPKVFTSDLPVDVVVRRLAEHGVDARTEQAITMPPPLDHPRPEPPPDPTTVTRLVDHLLSKAAPHEVTPPDLTTGDAQAVVDVCRDAVAARKRLWLQISDPEGMRTELVEPLALRGGQLTAWSLTAGRASTIAVARIAAFAGDA